MFNGKTNGVNRIIAGSIPAVCLTCLHFWISLNSWIQCTQAALKVRQGGFVQIKLKKGVYMFLNKIRKKLGLYDLRLEGIKWVRKICR